MCEMKEQYRIFPVFIGILLLFCACPYVTGSETVITNNTPGILKDEIISIDTITPRCVNDVFTVSGTTNLQPGTALRVTIERGSFNPGIPPQGDPWYVHLQKEIRVTADPVRGNVWKYDLNTTGSYPDEYLFFIEPYEKKDARAMAIFELRTSCSSGTVSASPGNTFQVSDTVKQMTSSQKTPPTPSAPGHGFTPIIALCLAVTGIALCQFRNR